MPGSPPGPEPRRRKCWRGWESDIADPAKRRSAQCSHGWIPADLNRRLGAYFTAHATRLDPAGLVPIALDGKTLRGALRAKAAATHLVSVFAHGARLVLGQLAVAEKSNEIPCVRELLKLLPRRVRWLVTVDAMHTQTATAKLICATLKSHYLMIVKSNQAKLLARITALPWADVPVVATDDTRDHGRAEQRTLQILTAVRGIGFPYASKSFESRGSAWSSPPANAASRWSTGYAAWPSSTPDPRRSRPGYASTGASRTACTGCAT